MPWGKSPKRWLDEVSESQLSKAIEDCAAEHRHLERIPVWLADSKVYWPAYIHVKHWAWENRN